MYAATGFFSNFWFYFFDQSLLISAYAKMNKPFYNHVAIQDICLKWDAVFRTVWHSCCVRFWKFLMRFPVSHESDIFPVSSWCKTYWICVYQITVNLVSFSNLNFLKTHCHTIKDIFIFPGFCTQTDITMSCLHFEHTDMPVWYVVHHFISATFLCTSSRRAISYRGYRNEKIQTAFSATHYAFFFLFNHLFLVFKFLNVCYGRVGHRQKNIICKFQIYY